MWCIAVLDKRGENSVYGCKTACCEITPHIPSAMGAAWQQETTVSQCCKGNHWVGRARLRRTTHPWNGESTLDKNDNCGHMYVCVCVCMCVCVCCVCACVCVCMCVCVCVHVCVCVCVVCACVCVCVYVCV